MLGFIFAILSLGLLVACVPAGGSTGKDIMGKPLVHGPWKTIDEAKGYVRFVGKNKPKIGFVKTRLRDNIVTEERTHLLTDVMSFKSGVALELLGFYAYYHSTTTEYLRDNSVVAEIAGKSFPGAALSEVKSGANANGKYLYTVGDIGGGKTCLFAHQGLNTPYGGSNPTEQSFNALISFRYCSTASERKILGIFDGIRVW